VGQPIGNELKESRPETRGKNTVTGTKRLDQVEIDTEEQGMIGLSPDRGESAAGKARNGHLRGKKRAHEPIQVQNHGKEPQMAQGMPHPQIMRPKSSSRQKKGHTTKLASCQNVTEIQ